MNRGKVHGEAQSTPQIAQKTQRKARAMIFYLKAPGRKPAARYFCRRPGESRDPASLLTAGCRATSKPRIPVGLEYMCLRSPSVYILASHRNRALYVGVTSNLVGRIWQHRSDLIDGYTKRYRVHLLVWFEQHETMESAILREKAIKEWKRQWKCELIERSNPYWRDLYPEICS